MAMSYLVAGQLPVRVGLGSQLTAPYGDFDCADGKIMIAVGNDKQFSQLCKVLGRPELAQEARFSTTPKRVEHRNELLPIMAALLREKPIAHWMPLLREAVVPAAPIYSFDQVYEDPQIRHRQLVKTVPHPLSGTLKVVGNPLNFSETPLEYHRSPPLLGEHTAEILREVLSLTEADIERLAQQKVTAA
jgi:crotonobetainyl-CoA:carnitine CoA-transferase CaiB-like acyl-CoA transferase